MNTELTFAWIADIILRHTTRKYTQDRFMTLICGRASPVEYDRPNFNRWLNGKKNASSEVYDFYGGEEAVTLLAGDIREQLIPAISDLPRLMEELTTAVQRDRTISGQKRTELLEGDDEAAVIAGILRFVVLRRNQVSTSGSPHIEGLFQRVRPLKPDRHFVGREQELEAIGERLQENHLLFLVGVPGIGKKALAKQYVANKKRQYRNCLYLRFRNNVVETIAGMGHIDDRPDDSQERRFERNSGLLQCLGEDSLLVIVGMDTLPEENEGLALLEELTCHVLVTTSQEMKNHPRLIIQPMDDVEQLFFAYCPRWKAGNREDVRRLMDCVQRHTYAVKLLALTVREGFYTPAELLQRVIDPEELMVEEEQEGDYRYDTVMHIVETLFSLGELNERQTQALRCFVLMPLSGVGKIRFCRWVQCRREVQYLIRLGWIQEERDGILSMNCVARDVIAAQLCPTAHNCKVLLDALAEECQKSESVAPLELSDCISGAFEKLRGLDPEVFSYLVPFMTFLKGMQGGLSLDLSRCLPEEERDGVRGQTLQIIGDCAVHLSERIASQMNGNGAAAETGEGRMLLERIQSLIPQADETVANGLRWACASLIVAESLGTDYGLILEVMEQNRSLETRLSVHMRDDEVDYRCLIFCLCALCKDNTFEEQYAELCQWKIEDAREYEDSEVYLERLDKLMELGRMAVSQTEEENQEMLVRYLRTEPLYAGILGRTKGIQETGVGTS